MTLWRYKAVPREGSAAGGAGGAGGAVVGEHAGESASEVRASLRRIGLQVLEIRPARRAPRGRALEPLLRRWQGHVRHRRSGLRAELFDALATLLDSGLPLLRAIEVVQRSNARSGRSVGSMLAAIREGLRSGASLSESAAEHPSWFTSSEVAMIEAGQHSGRLPTVLRGLATRHERSGALQQRLIGALLYPAIVAIVGAGVAIFLGVRTLPELVAILDGAGIETPRLTAIVMAVAGFVARWWPALLLGAAALPIGATLATSLAARWRGIRGAATPSWARRLVPQVVRRVGVARVAQQLSDLIESGVPFVDALRIVAPTTGGGALRARLEAAAECVEQGEEISAALDDDLWFDAEFGSLLDVGQASGELGPLLRRIAERYERKATRLIDRLTTILEPLVILLLALFVGTVVMAAVLPLLRLQEIL